MTPRENLLGMYRRQGYRHAPVGFGLCPSLWETYRELAGDTPFEEYFNYPEGFCLGWVPGPEFKQRQAVDWARYFDTPLKPGTTFNVYGVANEQ